MAPITVEAGDLNNNNNNNNNNRMGSLKIKTYHRD
jgi:hypothetical protein